MLGLGIKTYSGSVVVNSFKFNITTIGANETFTLPLISGGIFNFVANWGDGSPDSTITAYNVNNSHVYAAIGTYIITMTGICTRFAFNGTGVPRLRVKGLLEFIGDMGFTVLNFNGCSNLTGITSTMSNLKSLTTANSMFKGCYNFLTTVPVGIFNGCTAITNFANTFDSCSKLTTIPLGLFDKNVNVTTFASIFANCVLLTTIPSGLFDKNIRVINFSLAFYFSKLTSIPVDLFKYNTGVTTFVQTFYNCGSLTSIPADLFKYNTLVTTFNQTFAQCSTLASIPVDLFKFNTLVTNFSYIFKTCPLLASIPVNLFRYNTAVTDFSYAFMYCTALATIPVDLFRYNTGVTTFSGTFMNCTALATISADLFKYNLLATNFSYTFYNCPKAQFNINVFYAIGESGTRFLNKSINFSSCFYRTSFTGTQGTAPDLWLCNFGTGTPTKTGCFGGAGNSLTSLTNYASIPIAWGGPA